MEVAVQTAASYYIRQVQAKFAAGVYQTEPAACFCGSDQADPVIRQDRYGLAHTMMLCRQCGVIYANPRMTPATAEAFYRDEYRLIYDHGVDLTSEFARGQRQGGTLASYLDDYDWHPNTVIDLGCNTGAWLIPFQQAGAEVYGVEYPSANSTYGREQGIPILSGGLDQLEASGKRADLLIVNHVLEHFLDVEATVKRLRACLADDGLLFIGVPGLYVWNLTYLWQNAHTYQFTGDTLTYVMECCGFQEFYLDESIGSLWKKTDRVREKTDYDTTGRAHIWNYLFGDRKMMPPLRPVSKFSVRSRKQWITAAIKRHLPDISTLAHPLSATPEVVIIAGGPSVDGQVATLHRLIADGAKVVAIERMYAWCLKRGIVPDYVVVLDASDDVMESFHALSRTTVHLVASQCQPSVFDALEGYPTAIYFTPHHGIDWQQIWMDEGQGNATLVQAGGSVALCAVSIALTLGFSSLHVFGLDCHVGTSGYADGITGVGEQVSMIEVEIKDRTFRTTPAYLSFAQQFFMIWKTAPEHSLGTRIVIHGDSMISAMAKAASNISRDSDTMTMTHHEGHT